MTTSIPPAPGAARPGQYAAPTAAAGAPRGAAPAVTPWYRRLWVLITGGVVAILLVFGSGYAAGALATSMRGPGGMSFDQGDRGQFPGGPGSGELPDGFPGSGSGSTGSGT